MQHNTEKRVTKIEQIELQVTRFHQIVMALNFTPFIYFMQQAVCLRGIQPFLTTFEARKENRYLRVESQSISKKTSAE